MSKRADALLQDWVRWMITAENNPVLGVKASRLEPYIPSEWREAAVPRLDVPKWLAGVNAAIAGLDDGDEHDKRKIEALHKCYFWPEYMAEHAAAKVVLELSFEDRCRVLGDNPRTLREYRRRLLAYVDAFDRGYRQH